MVKIKKSEKYKRRLKQISSQWWILGEANKAAASRPPFWICQGDPLLKVPSVVLDYFVAFYKGPLASTTLEVVTKSGYFALTAFYWYNLFCRSMFVCL